MNKLILEIEKKINKQKEIKNSIHRINILLSDLKYLLSDNDVENLKNEKKQLENQIVKPTLTSTSDEEFKDFFYTSEEIQNAPETEWLIPDVIPARGLGVFFGDSGCGKSTLIQSFCTKILEKDDDIFIYYIDGDMSLGLIKEYGIGGLIDQYGDRIKYGGKGSEDFSKISQNLLRQIVEIQLKYPRRKYVVIEDSLTLMAPRKNGFINVELLYKFEKQICQAGGTIVIIHHTNKSGVFADSKQIENFSDYMYSLNFNKFNNTILLNPHKKSRFNILPKAYKLIDRKIICELDFHTANISNSESTFINIIIDLLLDGEMNQSEIKKYLKEIAFFSKYGVGEKKVLTWLDKWAKEGRWVCNQRSSEKNAKFYFLDSGKLEKLPNSGEKGVANEPI